MCILTNVSMLLLLLVQGPHLKHPRLEEGRMEGYVCILRGPDRKTCGPGGQVRQGSENLWP